MDCETDIEEGKEEDDDAAEGFHFDDFDDDIDLIKINALRDF